MRGILRKDALVMIGVGAILATHFTLWIGSLKIEGVSVSVASSVILVTSHPLLVGVLSHYVLKERLNAWMALGIALGFSGVVVIAVADSTARSGNGIGDLLAFTGRWVLAPVVGLRLVGDRVGWTVHAWAVLGQMPGASVGIGGALALGGIYLTAMGQGARSKETLGARDTG